MCGFFKLMLNYQVSNNCDSKYLIESFSITKDLFCLIRCDSYSNCFFVTIFSNVCNTYNKYAAVFLKPNDQYKFYYKILPM